MSRIGKKPVVLPEGVDARIDGQNIELKGPKGTLKNKMHETLTLKLEDDQIIIDRKDDTKTQRMLHGTARAQLENMVVGVSKGFTKKLKMVGVGYRAKKQGNRLVVSAGYSSDVEADIPDGIEVEVKKNTDITVSGIDRQKVGEFAAHIRAIRKPEPYLGKGIRYVDERVRRKEGKIAK